MNDSHGAYWPTFETQDTSYGEQFIVNWRGQRWGMLTPICENWQTDQYEPRLYEIRNTKVELSFKMVLLDEEKP